MSETIQLTRGHVAIIDVQAITNGLQIGIGLPNRCGLASKAATENATSLLSSLLLTFYSAAK